MIRSCQIDEPGYRRLTKTQAVGLRYGGLVITVENVVKDLAGEIVELQVKSVSTNDVQKKPKGFIHCVSQPITVEVRLYERL